MTVTSSEPRDGFEVETDEGKVVGGGDGRSDVSPDVTLDGDIDGTRDVFQLGDNEGWEE